MYFLVGRFDVNAMTQLCERYYNVLEAPHKELIWFEKSGHTPMQYEPNKVMDVMVNHVYRHPTGGSGGDPERS